MGLNIKNERVHALARQAAETTGKTQTGAIEEALQRLLADHGVDVGAQRARAKADLAFQIALRYQQTPSSGHPITSPDDLYDDATGLPR